jgi:hypothetical protein
MGAIRAGELNRIYLPGSLCGMDVNTPSKQMLFTTVRIMAHSPQGTSTGTGFLIDAKPAKDSHVPTVVTNKHVVAGATHLTFTFVARKPGENAPNLGEKRDFTFPVTTNPVVGHPNADVDVAAIPLHPVVAHAADEIYYRILPPTLLPTAEEGAKFDALEEITFVGYPSGLADPVHHTPIVRRGITATPMAVRFGGRPVFLVDGSVFGGSSGSPVYLYNEGSYTDGTGGLIVGSRFVLVGIIAETLLRNTELPLAVSTTPHVKLAQELNLGVAFSWEAIAETLAELRKVLGLGGLDQDVAEAIGP